VDIQTQQKMRLAARNGDAVGLREALAMGANPNGSDGLGRPYVLFEAAARGQTECVKILLPLVDASVVSRGGDALMPAAKSGNIECVKLLLPYCQPTRQNEAGLSALMIAAQSGSAECVKLLLPLSDPLAVDLYGCGALEHAAIGGNAEIARLLLEFCDPRRVSESGRTALMFAAGQGSGELVEALIPVSDVHAVDDDGLRAIDLSIEALGVAALTALIPGATQEELDFALRYAAQMGMLAKVKALARGGASVVARDEDGKTALDHAVEAHAEDGWGIADFLRKEMAAREQASIQRALGDADREEKAPPRRSPRAL
jgi:ankyrin repeat protein